MTRSVRFLEDTCKKEMEKSAFHNRMAQKA